MQLQKFYCNSYTTHSTHGVTYYDLMGYRDERSWQHLTHISPKEMGYQGAKKEIIN